MNEPDLSPSCRDQLNHLPLHLLQAVDQACDRFERACRDNPHADPAEHLQHFAHNAPTDWSEGEKKLATETLQQQLAAIGSAYQSDAPVGHADGNRFGRFQLVERLGAGEFGSVWKAYDVHLERYVAIKFPRPALWSGEQGKLFLQEARAAAKVCHPNVVSVHEFNRVGSIFYLVCDWIDGMTLRDALRRQRPSVDEAVTLCVKIARALDAVHAAGIVHRDLKPRNIMIDADGEPYLTDFGLAHLPPPAGAADSRVIAGTPAYMSPEQAAGKADEADARSDLYSLAAVFFELLTGRPPFVGDPVEVLAQHVRRNPPAPRSIDPSLPEPLAAIVLRGLAKDKRKRYATALDMVADLQQWQATRPGPPAPEVRRRLGARGLVLTASTLSVMAVAVADVIRDAPQSTRPVVSAAAVISADASSEEQGLAEPRQLADESLSAGREAIESGNLAEAKQHLLRAVDAYRRVSNASPRNRPVSANLADALKEMAQLILDAHDELGFAQAERYGRESLAICHSLEDHSPADRMLVLQEGETHMVLARVMRARGEQAAAVSACVAGIALLETYFGVLSGDPPAECLLVDLHLELARLSAMQFEFERSLNACRRAAECLAALRDDADGAHQQRRAAILFERGKCYLALGQLAEAEVAYREALQLNLELAANGPIDEGLANALAETQAEVARLILAQEGDHREVIVLSEAAAKTLDNYTPVATTLAAGYLRAGDTDRAAALLDRSALWNGGLQQFEPIKPWYACHLLRTYYWRALALIHSDRDHEARHQYQLAEALQARLIHETRHNERDVRWVGTFLERFVDPIRFEAGQNVRLAGR